jgi:hypothetical protein
MNSCLTGLDKKKLMPEVMHVLKLPLNKAGPETTV